MAYDWLFRPWFIFVVMELETRRIMHSAVIHSPTVEWTSQQLREATPWGKGPKYLLHDRDSKFASHFSAVVAGSGIKELKTPYQAPRAIGICERFMGSLRRECLDYTLILQGRHLTRVVKEYTTYFNQERPHQAIGQHIPDFHEKHDTNSHRRIISKPYLVGLHYCYSRMTYLN